MAFQYIENPLNLTPYSGPGSGGGGYQCHARAPKHYIPERSEHSGYQTGSFCVEPYVGGLGGRQSYARFPEHNEPDHSRHGYQTAHIESGVGRSRAIKVEKSVDDEADNYIKGIHKGFERRQWTFSE